MTPSPPRRIGFVDHQLDNYHARVFLAAIRGELKPRGFEVAGGYALERESGQAWAEKNGVPWFSSLRKLNEAVDAYMVLAPSNPELHLPLCRKVLPFGKITYVDKTFAPSLSVARKIFALADKSRTVVQTSSALRYTNVQAFVREAGGPSAVRHMVAWGGGSSFEEYAIHPVEMVVSCMGARATRLLCRGNGNERQILLDFEGGRTAVVNVYATGDMPFAASVTTSKETRHLEVDASRLFVDMASAILDFFESGRPSVARAESLMVRAILDATSRPASARRFLPLPPLAQTAGSLP